jgi:hypothetical protein
LPTPEKLLGPHVDRSCAAIKALKPERNSVQVMPIRTSFFNEIVEHEAFIEAAHFYEPIDD